MEIYIKYQPLIFGYRVAALLIFTCCLDYPNMLISDLYLWNSDGPTLHIEKLHLYKC